MKCSIRKAASYRYAVGGPVLPDFAWPGGLTADGGMTRHFGYVGECWWIAFSDEEAGLPHGPFATEGEAVEEADGQGWDVDGPTDAAAAHRDAVLEHLDASGASRGEGGAR